MPAAREANCLRLQNPRVEPREHGLRTEARERLGIFHAEVVGVDPQARPGGQVGGQVRVVGIRGKLRVEQNGVLNPGGLRKLVFELVQAAAVRGQQGGPHVLLQVGAARQVGLAFGL